EVEYEASGLEHPANASSAIVTSARTAPKRQGARLIARRRLRWGVSEGPRSALACFIRTVAPTPSPRYTFCFAVAPLFRPDTISIRFSAFMYARALATMMSVSAARPV